LHEDSLFVSGRRGFLGNVLNSSVAASLPSEYAIALPAVSADVLAEMEHVESLFHAYEEAWREAEAASEFIENPTETDECRWREARHREAEALHALLSYEDKSLSAFKIRADCLQIIMQDKPRRAVGDGREAFRVFLNSVGRF